MIAIDLLIVAVLLAAIVVAMFGPPVVRLLSAAIGVTVLLVLLVLVGVLAYGITLQRRREVRDRRALSP